ncbi:MAG: glycosyltransferase [Limnochordales bacterium]|nr:glycosyltransferase [Limnochordales bacterium]
MKQPHQFNGDVWNVAIEVLYGRRPRVLYVIPNFGSGGAERIVSSLIVGIDRSRYDVAAVSLFGRTTTDVQEAIDRASVPVWYLGKHVGFDPRMYWRLSRVLREYRPDIVHTHKYVLRYLFPFLFGRHDWIVVHTVHNVPEKEVDRIGLLIHRICFSRGVVPVAIASRVAEGLKELYKINEPVVIPNGIDVHAYRSLRGMRNQWRQELGLSSEEIVFVCVASLRPQKNHRLLLRAFARVVAQAPHARLLLAGDGPERPQLESLASELGVSSRVSFLGFRRDTPKVLCASDVFVLASDWEGNPLAVMEAMAAGKPVIATAVGGVPELIEDGRSGILIRAGDEGALVRAMVQLTNSAVREAMGRSAEERASARFSAKGMIDGYELLYERLLAKRRSVARN